MPPEDQTASATWDEPETNTVKAPKPKPTPQPSLPSAAEDAPGSQTEQPKRRGRPPADPNAAPKAPPAPAKEIGEMSLAELTKALAKAAGKAKAGHEALAEIEKINEAMQAKLG